MGHNDGSQRSLVNQFLASSIRFAVVALEADNDTQVLRLRLFTRRQDRMAAGHVNRQRLLSKDMLFRGDCAL
jgi:hypothetical protein